MPMSPTLRTLLLCALLLQFAAPLAAQDARPVSVSGVDARARLEAVRTSVPPTIDGRLDDEVWASAPVATGFVQARPAPGAPATHRTEVRLLYDDQALYIAARMHDSHPDSIVAELARRDQDIYSDWFTVGIDSYFDRRTAFVFGVNPRGVKRDLRIFNDRQEDVSWDAVWDVTTRIDSLGWTAEFRIPLSQLRFSRSAEEAVWGINYERRIARLDEAAHWSPIPPDAAGTVSRFGELRNIRDLPRLHRLELRPYTVARLSHQPNDPRNPFARPTAAFGSVGTDVQYGVTSDLTLSATFNPDFGQVEADPSEVNLTAFETFFEEKRPFFTEGSEIFSGVGPQLFYSRRIGRAPQGLLPAPGTRSSRVPEATTILGALKLTGKTQSGWSVGVLNAMTGRETVCYLNASNEELVAVIEPPSHYTVARVMRDFRGGRSAIGTTFTGVHRDLDDRPELALLRNAAFTAAMDGRHRFLGGNYELVGGVRGSHVRGSEAAILRVQQAPGRYFDRPDASHVELDPLRTALGGYSADASVARIGGSPLRWALAGHAHSPGFEINDLGFHSAPDETRIGGELSYERFRPGQPVQRWNVFGSVYSEQTFGGETLDRAFRAGADLTFRNQWSGSSWVMRHFQALSPYVLRGGPALTRPSRYMGGGGLNSDRRRPLTVRNGYFWEIEDDLSSYRANLNSTIALRASGQLSLSLRPAISWNRNAWQYVGRRVVAGQPVYLVGHLDQVTTSLQARVDYTFTPTLSFQLYTQPFFSSGSYTDFRTVADPRATRFDDRFHPLSARNTVLVMNPDGGRTYRVDFDGNGRQDFEVRDPSFNVQELRGNAVLRWEYRPGSTVFLVWSQGRSGRVPDGIRDFGRDLRLLGDAPATNVLLLKVSYWFGL